MLKEVRPAQEKDIKNLINLLHQIREFHCDFRPDIFIRGCIKYSEDDLKELLKEENRYTFVAVNENDEAIGHLFTILKTIDMESQTKRKELYIDDLCVDENERCSGVGHALMVKAEDQARELDCDFLTLNSWYGNDSAERFYENHGMMPRVTSREKKLK